MFGKLREALIPEWPQEEVPVRRKNYPKTKKKFDESQQMVLDFLKEYPDERLNYNDVAEMLGITQSYVSALITALMRNGAIRRYGKRGQYQHKILRNKAKRRAYKKRQGVPAEKAPSKSVSELRELVAADLEIRRDLPNRIVEYLRGRQGEFLLQDDIARGIGSHASNVSIELRKLEERGIINRSLPVRGHGTKYYLHESLDTTPRHVPTAPVPYKNEADERLIREFLVWYRSKKEN